MIDKEYVKGMYDWFKSMDLTIEQDEAYIAFHEKEIELHSAFLSLYKAALEHDTKRLIKAKEEFDKYVKENSPNPEVIAPIDILKRFINKGES